MPKFLRKNVGGAMHIMRMGGRMAREACHSRCCTPSACCDSRIRPKYCPDSPNGEEFVCCACGKEFDFTLDWSYFIQDGALPGAWGNPNLANNYPCTGSTDNGTVPPAPPNDITRLLEFQASIRFSVRCVNGVRKVIQTGPALYKKIDKHWCCYPFWPTFTPHYVFDSNINTADFREVYQRLFGTDSPCGLDFFDFTGETINEFGAEVFMPGQISGHGQPWSDCDGIANFEKFIDNPCPSGDHDTHDTGSFSWGGSVACSGGSVSYSGEIIRSIHHGPRGPGGADDGAFEVSQTDGSATWAIVNAVPCDINPCTEPPVPHGACCATTGDPNFPFSCTNRTKADCELHHGSYLGDGTDCATANCPLLGACCNTATNACRQTTRGFCLTTAGHYLGDGTRCVPGLCGAVGGCCLTDIGGNSICEIHNQPNCLARGGSYLGDNTTCSGDPCAPDTTPRGPCCIDSGGPDQECIENVTLAGCIFDAGFRSAYWEPGTTCATVAGVGCLSPGPGVVGFA